MNYGKFLAMVKDDALLERIAHYHLTVSAKISERQRKKLVTEKLKFMAYRDFSTLDLNQGGESKIEGHFWSASIYTVYFWVRGENILRSQTVSSLCEMGSQSTIQSVIEEILLWHSKTTLGPIKWEAVVKVTSSGGSSHISPKEIEVFVFPENYAPSMANK